MTDEIKSGAAGEEQAARFLEQQGFAVLERNYRFRKSEIDLIVCRGNWLVFVEVKTRTTTAFGFPEEFVDYKKKKNIFKGADHYMHAINWPGNVRYDIVAISLENGASAIHHIEDAFY